MNGHYKTKSRQCSIGGKFTGKKKKKVSSKTKVICSIFFCLNMKTKKTEDSYEF